MSNVSPEQLDFFRGASILSFKIKQGREMAERT